jgi:hypothetical protein
MTNQEAEKLVGAYRYAFGSAEGNMVLKDLAVRCGVIADDKLQTHLSHYAGSGLTHAECAYRNGMQDFFKYIEALTKQQ